MKYSCLWDQTCFIKCHTAQQMLPRKPQDKKKKRHCASSMQIFLKDLSRNNSSCRDRRAKNLTFQILRTAIHQFIYCCRIHSNWIKFWVVCSHFHASHPSHRPFPTECQAYIIPINVQHYQQNIGSSLDIFCIFDSSDGEEQVCPTNFVFVISHEPGNFFTSFSLIPASTYSLKRYGPWIYLS